MALAVAVLAGFPMAMAAPWVHRLARGNTGWVIGLLPLALALYFLSLVPAVADGEVIRASYEWVPSLGITLSFQADGLGLLFALLVTVVGALVMVYAGGYLHGHPYLGRFYVSILLFMGSMLGLVLADNIFTLFVFWELTSISSYLLIGFDHDNEASRSAALKALLVTAGGGLALLAGLVLLAVITGSTELSVIATQGDLIRAHDLYLGALVLVLLGAFTKSAQFPFHFWLPGAMAAPTPVSAYLHSATMVKAGVYLLARLHPAMGGTEAWVYAVTGAGAVTLVVGAYLALHQSDLKLILAYSTVAILGMLTMLIGLGTELAIWAMVVVLLGHAMYKGALFLVAGAVDHEAGTRDTAHLSGLRKAMPITAAAASIAALSMAGIPPFFGFIGKEALYEAVWHGETLEVLVLLLTVGASVFLVAVATMVSIGPFFGKEAHTPKHPHEAPPSMWLGPVTLATLGVLFGLLTLLPIDLVDRFLSVTAGNILFPEPVARYLALWHGFGPNEQIILGLSAATVATGAGLYTVRGWVAHNALRVADAVPFGPERGYGRTVDGMLWVAKVQTKVIQNGYLRFYLLMVFGTAFVLVGYTLASRGGVLWPDAVGDVHVYEVAIAVMILGAALGAAVTSSKLTAVAALGVVGFGIAFIFILYSAPDLAMTQVLVETLTVILFVFVFVFLPRSGHLSKAPARIRDAAVALAGGTLATMLVLVAIQVQVQPPISEYFVAASYPEAHGRNIVNVILVDFRALDTLGEILVLVIAGIGVYALLKLKPWQGGAKE